ncbi:MAG: hypothetical protein ACHQNE_01320 [Candidatus Kapaibacterium sp.]
MAKIAMEKTNNFIFLSRGAALYSQPSMESAAADGMLGREFQKHFSSPGGVEYFTALPRPLPQAGEEKKIVASFHPGLRFASPFDKLRADTWAAVLRAFGTLSVILSHKALAFVQLSAEFLTIRKIPGKLLLSRARICASLTLPFLKRKLGF